MTQSTDDASTTALDAQERAELERLRAEAAGSGPTGPASRAGRGRWTGAIVLMLLAALLAPLSALATWTRTAILDSDRYVAMVAPLAEDPAVQEEISWAQNRTFDPSGEDARDPRLKVHTDPRPPYGRIGLTMRPE